MPKGKETLSAFKMSQRIFDRADNVYNKKVIMNILQMYMEECRKALLAGERVEITRVGNITPEIKVHEGNYNLPICNKDSANPPYTKLKMTRAVSLGSVMNNQLIKNIKKGVYGLEKLPFSKQQFAILKKSGYLPEDAELEGDDE